MEKPKLYAFLVGVNEYPEPVPPLACCENDVAKMEAYLKKQTTDFSEILIESLTGTQATKTGIVDGFLSHLGKAQEEDTALFYFSGHGTQEEADTHIWTNESDGQLECLVPIDGIVKMEGGTSYNLLADKELRYLFQQLKKNKPHLVTIFDCCHSGEMTRNAHVKEADETAQERRVARARLTENTPVRPWTDFIFEKEVDSNDLATQPIDEVLPSYDHIQLAACQPDQSAFEINGAGVFTKNLIEILERSEGQISYYDLQSRIKYYIKNQYDQTPQVYVKGLDDGALFRGFLGKEIDGKPIMANVTYNEKVGWIMDMGAMHGVSYEAESVQLLDEEGSAAGKADILEIKESFTVIEPHESIEGTGHKAYLDQLLSSPISIYLQVERADSEALELFKEQLKEVGKNLHITDKKHQADFFVKGIEKFFTITQTDKAAKPIVEGVKIANEELAKTFIVYLNYISQFEFVRTLENPKSFLFNEHPIKIEITQHFADGKVENLDLSSNTIPAAYEQQSNGSWKGTLKMKLTNVFNRPLYLSFIFLSELYQVYPKLLGDYVIKLDPGESTWAFGGSLIPLKLPQFIRQEKWPYCTTYFKLIVSTNSFETAMFEQAALPPPGNRSSGEASKGLKLKKKKKRAVNDWSTRLLTMKMKNPYL